MRFDGWTPISKYKKAKFLNIKIEKFSFFRCSIKAPVT